MQDTLIKKLASLLHDATTAARPDTMELNKAQGKAVERLKAVLDKASGLCGEAKRFAVDILAVGCDKPFLRMALPDGNPSLAPLTVVKLNNKNTSGHKYRGVLYIALADNRLLALNGLRGRRINSADYDIATPKEVDQCVKTLTASQLGSIQNSAAFQSALNSVD